MAKRACIIGAGFGGLGTAILLAADGWEVTILEKNQDIGGRARVWHEKGFVFDMGPSWYLMPEVFDRFFAKTGRTHDSYYQLRKLSPYYRVFFGNGKTVDITGDKNHDRSVFESLETGGGEKLDRYLAAARYKYDVAMREFLYKEYRSIAQFFNWRILTEGLRLNIFDTLDRYVRRFFKSTEARQILEYAMVFLGTGPKQAPALYSIMSHVDLNLGVYFPAGGMTSLVNGLQQLATELGVVFRTGTEVRSIECHKGKAIAAISDSGRFEADLFVSNADYAYTDTVLLDPAHRSYSTRYWQKRVYAPTMFIIYLGLSKKLKSVVHHNLYFSSEWDTHFTEIFDTKVWPEDPCYYVSVASHDDPEVAPTGKENVFFLVPVSPGLSDPDDFRRQYAQKIMAHFEKLTGETIQDSIEIMRIYSHKDFSGDYHAWQGTALGMAHTLFQTAVFRPSMRSKKVKNLRFVGQYTHPGVGVPMTLIASEILADSVRQDYGSQKQESKKPGGVEK